MEIDNKRQGGGEMPIPMTPPPMTPPPLIKLMLIHPPLTRTLLSRRRIHSGAAETLVEKWDDASADGDSGDDGRMIYVSLIYRFQ